MLNKLTPGQDAAKTAKIAFGCYLKLARKLPEQADNLAKLILSGMIRK